MKIAHVITGLGVGGAERVLLELGSELANRGHDVRIWSLTTDTGSTDRGVDRRININVLAVSRNPARVMCAFVRFVREVNSFGPAVVHAHMFHALMFALAAKLLLTSRPRLVFTSHSYAIRGKWRRFFVRATRRWRDGDVVFSKSQHPALNARCIAVIPNGVSLLKMSVKRAREARPDGLMRFINVARFTEPKGHDRLVQEFAKVVDQGIDAELWLVGDGPLLPCVERAIKNLGLDDRVKLLGMRTDVMQLLESADVFVMSSRWEGLPIALLEAGLAGLPVISTPAGSIPDLLEGGCGIVVASENLAAAMMDATRNRGGFREMGQRLRQRIESKYSVSAMASAHLVFYADGAPAAAIPNRGDT